MKCKYCGAPLSDDTTKCPFCGAFLENEKKSSTQTSQEQQSTQAQPQQPFQTNTTNQTPTDDSSKTMLGLIAGLFLGFFALFIALLYPSGSNARKTFIKGCIIALVLGVVVPIAIFALIFIGIAIFTI